RDREGMEKDARELRSDAEARVRAASDLEAWLAASRTRLINELASVEHDRFEHAAAVGKSEEEGKARLAAIAAEQAELARKAAELEARRDQLALGLDERSEMLDQRENDLLKLDARLVADRDALEKDSKGLEE